MARTSDVSPVYLNGALRRVQRAARIALEAKHARRETCGPFIVPAPLACCCRRLEERDAGRIRCSLCLRCAPCASSRGSRTLWIDAPLRRLLADAATSAPSLFLCPRFLLYKCCVVVSSSSSQTHTRTQASTNKERHRESRGTENTHPSSRGAAARPKQRTAHLSSLLHHHGSAPCGEGCAGRCARRITRTAGAELELHACLMCWRCCCLCATAALSHTKTHALLFLRDPRSHTQQAAVRPKQRSLLRATLSSTVSGS